MNMQHGMEKLISVPRGDVSRERLPAGIPVIGVSGWSWPASRPLCWRAAKARRAGPTFTARDKFAAKWLRVIPDLVRTHRVIAPDLPGHGTSEVIDDPLDANRVLTWLSELIERTLCIAACADEACTRRGHRGPFSCCPQLPAAIGWCWLTRWDWVDSDGTEVCTHDDRFPRPTDRGHLRSLHAPVFL